MFVVDEETGIVTCLNSAGTNKEGLVCHVALGFKSLGDTENDFCKCSSLCLVNCDGTAWLKGKVRSDHDSGWPEPWTSSDGNWFAPLDLLLKNWDDNLLFGKRETLPGWLVSRRNVKEFNVDGKWWLICPIQIVP